jgi:hypothetical protein
MDGPETPAEPAAKPRVPVSVVGSVVLLWLMAAALVWLTAVSAILTGFEVSTRYHDSLAALAYVEPLLFLVVAAATGLVAVKVWTGRDWARRSVVLVAAVMLVVALFTRAGLTFGTGLAGTLLFLLLLVLSALPASQRWCDRGSARHSPRIGDRVEPPFLVVAELVLLWAAVVFSVHFGVVALLANDGGEDPGFAVWAALAMVLLAVVHGALNIGLTRRRNWGRLGTVGLALLYGLWLIWGAVAALVGSGPWVMLLVLCLVPAAFVWALLNAESKTWCARSG